MMKKMKTVSPKIPIGSFVRVSVNPKRPFPSNLCTTLDGTALTPKEYVYGHILRYDTFGVYLGSCVRYGQHSWENKVFDTYDCEVLIDNTWKWASEVYG